MTILGGIDSATDVPTRDEQRIQGPYNAISRWRPYFRRTATLGVGWTNAGDWPLNATGLLVSDTTPLVTTAFWWYGSDLVVGGWTLQWSFRCWKYTSASFNATYRLWRVDSNSASGTVMYVTGHTELASLVVMFDQATGQTILTAPTYDAELQFSMNPSATTTGTSMVACELYYRYV